MFVWLQIKALCATASGKMLWRYAICDPSQQINESKQQQLLLMCGLEQADPGPPSCGCLGSQVLPTAHNGHLPTVSPTLLCQVSRWLQPAGSCTALAPLSL